MRAYPQSKVGFRGREDEIFEMICERQRTSSSWEVKYLYFVVRMTKRKMIERRVRMLEMMLYEIMAE